MSDLLIRLRELAAEAETHHRADVAVPAKEAADRIEALEAEVERLDRLVDRLVARQENLAPRLVEFVCAALEET